MPLVARWPGRIRAGVTSDEFCSTLDLFPTFLAVSGATSEPSTVLDGYNILDHLRDPENVSSGRAEVFYFSDTGDLTALRYNDWKMMLPKAAPSK